MHREKKWKQISVLVTVPSELEARPCDWTHRDQNVTSDRTQPWCAGPTVSCNVALRSINTHVSVRLSQIRVHLWRLALVRGLSTIPAWSEIWCVWREPNMVLPPPLPLPPLLPLQSFFSLSFLCSLHSQSTQEYGNNVALYEWKESGTPLQRSVGVKKESGRHSSRECVGAGGRVGVIFVGGIPV